MAGFTYETGWLGLKSSFSWPAVGIVSGLFLTNGKFYFELDIPLSKAHPAPMEAYLESPSLLIEEVTLSSSNEPE